MVKKKGGLGRGLNAFGLSSDTKKNESNKAITETKKISTDVNGVQEIDINLIKINPHQPRNEFDEESLNALQDSIKEYGVLQPVILRKSINGYELIAGERRLRASKLAGKRKIPAVIKEYNDAHMTEIALIENIQRENLNPIEEAV